MASISIPTVEVISSDDAIVAAEVFDRLLSNLVAANFLDEFSDAAWTEICRGGWLQIGAVSSDQSFSLVDLVEFAEVWGRYLIPSPFLTTVLAVRWLGIDCDVPQRGYTYSLASPDGRALIPFGGLEGVVCLESLGSNVPDSGALEFTMTGEDLFAPSLPLAVATEGTNCESELIRETLVLLAAETVGGARVCLQRTIDYAMIRRAYDQEIGKFQVVRHRLADMHRDIEIARGLLVLAANNKSAAPSACALVASLMRGVTEGAIQIHGGIGFSWDIPVHRYLRHISVIEKLIATQNASLSV